MTEFQHFLIKRGCMPRTQEQYVRAIREIEVWLAGAGQPPLRQCKPDALSAYAATKPNTNSTRNRIRSALKQYWTFLGRKQDTCPTYAIPCPKRSRMVCKAIEPDAMAMVLEAARSFGPQRYAYVCALYYAALRREEACTLTWPQVTGRLHLVGKGGREADLPLHPELEAALALIPRRSFYVFPGRFPHTHMANNTANVWLREVGAAAGIRGLRPHVLRHTALAAIVDNTGDLRAAQELARHADPRTTSGYTRATEARMKMALDALTLGQTTDVPIVGEVAAGGKAFERDNDE